MEAAKKESGMSETKKEGKSKESWNQLWMEWLIDGMICWLPQPPSLWREWNAAPTSQKRGGKRANNTNSFSAAGRGKPAENGVGFAFLLLPFFALVGPLAPLASSIKKKLNFFLYCGMVDYGLGASQANKQSKEANEN